MANKRITNVTIENFKGIDSKSLDFIDFFSNRLNLLVAPNGFGKSSIAQCFDSLIRGKLKLPEKWEHDHSNGSNQKLAVSYKFGDQAGTLVADSTKNEISRDFEVVVINSKLTSVTKQGFQFAKATSKIGYETLTLVDKIPKKVDFPYKKSTFITEFRGKGFNLVDLRSTVFINPAFVLWLFHQDLSTKIKLKTPKTKFSNIKAELMKGAQSYSFGTIEGIISGVDFFKEIFDEIKEIKIHASDSELVIAWYELVSVLYSSHDDLKNASEYFLFDLWKRRLTDTLNIINSAPHPSAELKTSKGALRFDIVNFQKLSNGQRDVTAFIAQLFKAEYQLLNCSSKDNSILIIDEVFDYLDDANIVSCQYFVSKFIESFLKFNKDIFPVVLTHLAPSGFDSFKTHKMKSHFLLQRTSKVTDGDVRKVILARSDYGVVSTDKDLISHFYVHFTDRITNNIPTIGLSANVSGNQSFYGILKKNIKSYLEGKKDYDPFAVCLGLRIEIEKYAYNIIPSAPEKSTYIGTKETANKLSYVEGLGHQIPEAFYLLGIIYNETAHTKEHELKFVESKITAQLNNQIISTLMKEALKVCGY